MIGMLLVTPGKITDVLECLNGVRFDVEGDTHPLLEGLGHWRFLVLLRGHVIVNGGG